MKQYITYISIIIFVLFGTTAMAGVVEKNTQTGEIRVVQETESQWTGLSAVEQQAYQNPNTEILVNPMIHLEKEGIWYLRQIDTSNEMKVFDGETIKTKYGNFSQDSSLILNYLTWSFIYMVISNILMVCYVKLRKIYFAFISTATTITSFTFTIAFISTAITAAITATAITAITTAITAITAIITAITTVNTKNYKLYYILSAVYYIFIIIAYVSI
jgi:hypothetical protein